MVPQEKPNSIQQGEIDQNISITPKFPSHRSRPLPLVIQLAEPRDHANMS